jgi:putative ABC transport system ATP-binding protein
VSLEAVARRYGTRHAGVWALRKVSLSVPAGSFVAVMGATGSGKSTLLRCAAGLDRPASGTVRLVGRDITRMRQAALTRLRRDRVGFVFQSYNLLSELTVTQNVLLPSRLGGPKVTSSDLGRLLAAVGLSGLGRRRVGELSGGEQQRVGPRPASAGVPDRCGGSHQASLEPPLAISPDTAVPGSPPRRPPGAVAGGRPARASPTLDGWTPPWTVSPARSTSC